MGEMIPWPQPLFPRNTVHYVHNVGDPFKNVMECDLLPSSVRGMGYYSRVRRGSCLRCMKFLYHKKNLQWCMKFF